MFDEPRRLPTACVAQLFAWLPMLDWFALRRTSRRLSEQSTDEAARPTRFAVCYDQIGLAHRHCPHALFVGYRHSGEGEDDECDTYVLPEMVYLEHLRLHAPIDDVSLSALLAALVRLKTLELGRNCLMSESIDFSALRALEHLDLDRDQLTRGMAQTLPASLRSLSARVGYGSHEPVDLYPYLRNLTALCLTQLNPDCCACVAAISAHMPHLVDLTLHVMSDIEARVFAKLPAIETLGAIADRQLLAFTALRQLRRLTVIGNVASYSIAAPSDILLPPPPSSPVPSAVSVVFAILCRLPAMERLDLAGLVVHCRSEQSLADERAKFEADARACRSVAIAEPVWRVV